MFLLNMTYFKPPGSTAIPRRCCPPVSSVAFTYTSKAIFFFFFFFDQLTQQLTSVLDEDQTSMFICSKRGSGAPITEISFFYADYVCQFWFLCMLIVVLMHPESKAAAWICGA